LASPTIIKNSGKHKGQMIVHQPGYRQAPAGYIFNFIDSLLCPMDVFHKQLPVIVLRVKSIFLGKL